MVALPQLCLLDSLLWPLQIINPGHALGLNIHWTCFHLFPESSLSLAIGATHLCCPHSGLPSVSHPGNGRAEPQTQGQHNVRSQSHWRDDGLPATVPSRTLPRGSSRALPPGGAGDSIRGDGLPRYVYSDSWGTTTGCEEDISVIAN